MSVLVHQRGYISDHSKLSTSIDNSTLEMNDSEILVSSPYTGHEHHLDLKSVSETSRQLALALQRLQPIIDDYPASSYVSSFNWKQVVDLLPSSFSGSFTHMTSFDSRHFLLYRLLLHLASQRRYLKTPLSGLTSACGSKSVGGTPQILVAEPS